MHLRWVIAADPSPLSPRLGVLRSILVKLEPRDRAPRAAAGAEGWQSQHGGGQVPVIATGVRIMSERRPKLFEDRREPGTWRVEWIDDAGGMEIAIFAGPNARERAIGYSFERYKDFEVISYP